MAGPVNSLRRVLTSGSGLTNDIALELIHVLLGFSNAPVYLTQHSCSLHAFPVPSLLCLPHRTATSLKGSLSVQQHTQGYIRINVQSSKSYPLDGSLVDLNLCGHNLILLFK